jgi:D-alanyl-D-alanine carboxypeptidase/D-alanyl-D-alanine-endopeptidase (penicillin-binding protein 4)
MRRSQKIDSVITTIQRDSDDSFIKQIKWVDGSGLSRYNLMRPVDLVGILHAIHQEVPENRWMSLLPQAGKTGTLRNIQLKNSELLVWAKSGSFANTCNLSGFARTPKGKWLAFSILSNLANQSVAASKAQVVQFLNQLSAL